MTRITQIASLERSLLTRKERITVILAAGLAAVALCAPPVFAQEAVYGVAVPGQSTALYYAGPIGMSEGFVVYRVDGNGDELLTPEPIRPAPDADDFFAASGADAERLMEALEVATPTEAYLRLRLDETLGNLHAIVDPGVARGLGRLFVDTTEANAARTYRLAIVDGLGRASGDSEDEFTITVTPTTIPVPTAVEAAYADGRITLSWSYNHSGPALDAITSFSVFEETATETVRIRGAGTLRQVGVMQYSTSIEAGSPGAQRSFRIAATDFSGRSSAASDVATAVVVDDIPPDPITDILVEALDSRSVELGWSYAGEPASAFRIYRSRDVTADFSLVAEVEATAVDVRVDGSVDGGVDGGAGGNDDGSGGGADDGRYVDRAVQPGRVYHYQVSAVDAAGNEAARTRTASLLVEDREAPAAPVDLAAAVDAGAVQLSWSPSTAPDLNTHVVLRRNVTPRGGGPAGLRLAQRQPFANINTGRVRAGSFSDAGPTGAGFEPGAYYEYGIFASDSSANRSDTVFVQVQIPDNDPPTAPILQTQARNSVVAVTWNPSSSRDVVSYQLRRTGSSGNESAWTFDQNTTSYVDRDVVRDARYMYAITAVDSTGNVSVASSDTVSIRSAQRPDRVRNVAATYANGFVLVSWSSESSVSRFQIYRATGGAEFAPVAEVSDVSSYVDATGGAGDVYYVVAVSTDGRSGTRSTRVVATTATR